LLAAALQDYHRAVIVGSSTYGKATMQQFFPVDTLLKNSPATSGNGYVKITGGKLYRVTGQTAQLNGVIPDIHLPDAFDAVHYGEKYMPDALPSDTVKRNAYFRPLPPLPLAWLNQLSNQRVSGNQNFQQIQKAIQEESRLAEASTRVVPLKLEWFNKWENENKSNGLLFNEKEMPPSKVFIAQNHKDDMPQLLMDAYAKSVNDVILKNIQQDIYIEEAYRITLDLIQSQPKN
jgi:carboxyl-terminal processing protease